MELEVGCVVLDGEAWAEELTLTITIEYDAIGRGGETKDIAHLMMLRPALGIVRADEGRVIDQMQVIPYYFVSPVGLEDVPEVKEKLAVGTIGIGGTQQTNALGRGELSLNAEVLQAHGVVARGGRFFGLVELRHRA